MSGVNYYQTLLQNNEDVEEAVNALWKQFKTTERENMILQGDAAQGQEPYNTTAAIIKEDGTLRLFTLSEDEVSYADIDFSKDQQEDWKSILLAQDHIDFPVKNVRILDVGSLNLEVWCPTCGEKLVRPYLHKRSPQKYDNLFTYCPNNHRVEVPVKIELKAIITLNGDPE